MQEPASPESFPFHHGRLSLSFAATLAHRGSEAALDRIAGSQRLADWLVAAELLAAGSRPPGPLLYRQAIELREAIWRCARAVVRGAPPPRADVETVNARALRWSGVPQLDPKTLRVRAHGGDPLRNALGRIALDALSLLGDPQERARLRACEGALCTALFLDPGRGRPRRWCSMQVCGNRAKVIAFRTRRKGNE